MSDIIVAKTRNELERKVNAWYSWAVKQGLEGVEIPWHPDKILQTENGYEYVVAAHT